MTNTTKRGLLAAWWGSSLACTVPASTVTLADEIGSSESTSSTDSTGPEESIEESTEESTGSDDTTEVGEGFTDTDTTDDSAPPDLPPLDPNENIPPPDVDGCPGIFGQDLFPTFELTIASEVWDDLLDDWQAGAELDENDEEYKPLRPLEAFAYEDIVIYDAMIRLRGNGTQWDLDGKMQFHVDFNEIDPNGRFLGQRHMAFDAAPANKNFLRDRLALWIMRDMGITATCANHARVNVNGSYYGLFTSLEKIDKSFLERAFEDPSGDLWDRHDWKLKTNETTADDERLEALKDADSASELQDYLDLEQALRVFAAEALLPDSDGMWAGGLNFFLYDEPIGGKFMMLPWDKDNTFDRFNGSDDYPANPDPVAWEKVTSHGRPFYVLALADDDWFDFYIGAIADQLHSSYDPDLIHELIDLWTMQIEDAAFEDENKSFNNSTYVDEVEILHDYIDDRHDFLEDWLWCWENGGEPDDEGYCVIY